MSGTALLPLDPELVPYAESGMPEGAFPLAAERALRAAELASVLLGTDVAVDALSVALVLHLPEVMAASYGSYWWPTPPPPRPAPGGGWYNAELGSPENAEQFARLSATLPPDCDATAVAAAAQEWRLPVCDYRPGAQSPPWRPGTAAPSTAEATVVVEGAGVAPTPEPSLAPPLSGLRVLDLTSMWAGPLATWLLARLGADVVKIDPAARPDGFRARHGRGVWPGGRARRGDGSESAVFNALNSDKRSWAVDAYDSPDWLAALARSADLVVDSFSPRVMGQIGLDPVGAGPSSDGGAGRTPLRLSMPAFPPGPMRHWVAYGTGVHALSGLGHQPGDGVTFRSPGVTYPDPLAGLQGAAVALAALSGGPARNPCGREEVSLATSLEPLLDRPRRLLPPLPGTGSALLRSGVGSGAVAAVEDGAGRHWYPLGPFRFPRCADLRPAPPAAEVPPEGDLPWTR